MTAKGIRKLDPRERLPWEEEAGIKEPEQRVVSKTRKVARNVRFIVVSDDPADFDTYGLVCNAHDTTGNRVPAFGIPGGEVESGETPLQALIRHEGGELPWERVGDPVPMFELEEVRRDWKAWNERKERAYFIEEDTFFLVVVSKKKRVSITPEESQEISHAEFFSPEQIAQMREPLNPNRQTRKPLGQSKPLQNESAAGATEKSATLMYGSHKRWFFKCREWCLEWMRQNGEI